MLSVKGLYFRHKEAKEDTLKGISFDAEKGSITTILGPNGCGKTTLFKCIAGVWKYYKGEIYFDGMAVEKFSLRERARIFSVVPQEHEPPFPYSVLDVVLTGRATYLGVFSSPGKRDFDIAEEALRMVGIERLKNKPYTKISGGERQLTLIARALAQQTPVMLLDEPTSHLDFKNQINVLKKIKELAIERKLTVIMTLHDPNLAMFFSDKIVMINSGSVVCSGTPEEVITQENIKKVYDVDVSLIHWNEKLLICPSIKI